MDAVAGVGAESRLPNRYRAIARTAWPEAAVVVVALLARLGLVANGGGWSGSFGYDASVYYTSADALLSGRLPYRDFTFLHPPGMALFLTPFALLGRLTTDHAGFIAACLACTLIGATNALLVVRIARAIGLGTGAAAAGGLVYALWPGAAASEYLCRLEPVGNLFFLTALLFFVRRPGDNDRRNALLCGVALAGAISIKLWWVAPAAVLTVACLSRSRRRQLGSLLLGLAGTLVLVDGVFFVAAPHRMIRMIVVDQLARPDYRPLQFRLASLTGAGVLNDAYSHRAEVALAALGVLVVLAVCVFAARRREGRLIVALLATTYVVLLLTQSFYEYYNDYLAGPLAVAVAVALSGRGLRPVRTWRFVLVPALAAAYAIAASARGTLIVPPDPDGELARAVAGSRCVMSNNPMALITMNVLSRGLANGCPNWVDFEGRLYDVGDSGRPAAAKLRWEHQAYRYLLSGDALVLFGMGGVDRALAAKLNTLPVLGSDDDFTVWLTAGGVRDGGS